MSLIVKSARIILAPMSALSISLSGLQRAGARFETSARQIVSAGTVRQGAEDAGPTPAAGAEAAIGAPRPGFSPDMATAMVGMIEAENAYAANARVAGRIAEMQKAYLDALAPKSEK